VEEFPDPSYLPPVTDPNKMIDDDVVISHGESLLHPDYNSPNEPQQPHALNPNGNFNQHAHHRYEWYHWIPLGIVVMAVSIVATREWMRHYNRRRKYYSPIINHESHHTLSAAVA
jgi:hypothetical protein